MTNLIGHSLGRYHIREKLGEGGMATVYKAYDTRLERDVAVKIIRRDAFPPNQLDLILKRFEREAKALAKLSHPNIVGVIDYGDHEGSPYLVMEFLPSGTLKQRMGTPIPWQEAVRTLLPIAKALDYAHRRGIVHRDIKPSNLLITESGEPMISDFGIAKILDSGDTATLTGTGTGIGTPEYMAPEQWIGNSTVQSDIYSLGVVLYEMITGRKPYTADTPAGILVKLSTEPLPRPGKFSPGLPESVEKVLLKVLARKPEDRYLDIRAFVEGMETLLEGKTKRKNSGSLVDPALLKVMPAVDTHATVLQDKTNAAQTPKNAHVVFESEIKTDSYTRSSTAATSRFGNRFRWIASIFAVGLCLLIAIPISISWYSLATKDPGVSGMAETFSPIPILADADTPKESPTISPTEKSSPPPTEALCPPEPSGSGKVQIRWFVGLGTGSDPAQVKVEKNVVNDFNASQDKIELELEIVPYASAVDTLSKQIATGNGPDIIGPIGFGGSNKFHGQWLDLTSLIVCTGFDTSQFNPSLVEMYKTEEGQVSLPFAVYPSVLFYNKSLFDKAGLAYPPNGYGKKYKMPDGNEVTWDWNALANAARLLTIDSTGRNSTESGFNRNNIVQYGYTWQYENHPNYWGSFWASGSMVAPGGSPGIYRAQAPEAWKAAWNWTYDAIWDAEPFMASKSVEESQAFGGGNPFNSKKVAMTVQPFWYTCCTTNIRSWDMAALPSYNGKVGGRIDADSLRIWKGTRNSWAAFTVLTYLMDEGVQKLIVGSASTPAAYGGFPGLTRLQDAKLSMYKTQFPWVNNWGVVQSGLNYSDIPSAEGYMPNYTEAWYRGDAFGILLRSTNSLNLEKEIEAYLKDLNRIFNFS